VSMYGNGTVIISLKLNSVLSLYFLNEDNLWILQVTYIPLILTSLLLHLFIMNFMWKNGKLKQPIDKIFFMDLAASLFFMLIMLLDKHFYSNLSRHDPGIIFCIIDRIASYGGRYVHRFSGTANAVMRSTFVCNAKKMLDPKIKRKFINEIFWKTFCLLSVTMLMLLVALAVPGQEKSSQSWSNCRRTPEITRYNFQDFYMPHEKSKYDILVFSLTILPMACVYFISILIELHQCG
jgi:hypothetical protein